MENIAKKIKVNGKIYILESAVDNAGDSEFTSQKIDVSMESSLGGYKVTIEYKSSPDNSTLDVYSFTSGEKNKATNLYNEAIKYAKLIKGYSSPPKAKKLSEDELFRQQSKIMDELKASGNIEELNRLFPNTKLQTNFR